MSEERDWNRVREWNAGIIEEFRAHEGKLGGRFAGEPVLLLYTFGAKSGLERVDPMRYLDLEGRRFAFASSGGADKNPDWYHNLVAWPSVIVEEDPDVYRATAVPLTGPEGDRIYDEQTRRHPRFAEYQTRTSRAIPVVELRRS